MNQKDADDLLRYYALVDSMNDAFGVVDNNRIFIYVNKRFGELLNYAPTEIVGRHITDFLDEKNRGILANNIRKREQGLSSQYEIEWTTSDGKQIPTIVSGAPLVDEEGIHRGSYAVVTDISAIRYASEALKTSEKLYRSVVETMNEGLLLVDPNYIITYANPSFFRIMGYSEAEVIGRSIVDFIHENMKDEVSTWVDQRKTEFSQNYEIAWQSKEGKIVYTFTTPRGIFDAEGSLSGILGVIVNITARKEAEEALKHSEQRYRALFQETPIGIITTTVKGDISGINRTALEIIGSESEEQTRKINIFSFQPLIDVGIPEAFKQVIEENRIIEGELRYRSSWGKEVYLHYKLSPMISQSDTVDSILVVFDDVSEIRKAEDAIKQSEDNYRTLAEKSLQGLSVIQNGVYAYVNPAFAQIVGYSPGEILAMESDEAWTTLIYPDDRAYLLELAKLRNDGKPTPNPYEYRLVRRDGTVRWVEAFANNTVFGGEKATQIHVIDITDRKVAEMQLKASQNMLQLVMNNIPQFIFWKDTSSIYMGCNEIFAKAAGVKTPENIVGKTDFDLAWRREEAETFRESDREVMETGEPIYDIIELQLRADGREAWLRTSKVPLLDEHGNVIGVLGTQEDVTEKLETEEAIRKSETKYRTLAEQSIQGLTIVTTDGFAYVNRAFADMVGRPVKALLEMVGDEIWEVLHPEDRPILKERMEARIEKRALAPRHEYRVLRPDGSLRWLEAYAQTIDYQGLVAIQTVWVDVTERRKAEKEVRTEKDRATLYLDLMGHDIRQQLQVIMNSATLLRTATEEDVRTSFFGIIEEAVQRCSRLIEEVRATEYLMTLPMASKNLLIAIQGCIQALAPHSTYTQFHLSAQVSDAIILADDFLELLITNILMNAIEHNPKKEKNVWIDITEDHNNYYVMVADDGPGIGDKRKTELFDMARRFGGVGLHQSNQIIEKYGGSITVMDRVEG
ncbi:MAG: PAS domain S-box protein, partial [Candidatus Thorarchaeota archaeon]